MCLSMCVYLYVKAREMWKDLYPSINIGDFGGKKLLTNLEVGY